MTIKSNTRGNNGIIYEKTGETLLRKGTGLVPLYNSDKRYNGKFVTFVEPHNYTIPIEPKFSKPIVPNLVESKDGTIDENGFMRGIKPYIDTMTNRRPWLIEKGNLNPNERVASQYDQFEAFFNKYPNAVLNVDDYTTGETIQVDQSNRNQVTSDAFHRPWYKFYRDPKTRYNLPFNPANSDPQGLLKKPTVLPNFDFNKGTEINKAIANGEYVNYATNNFQKFVEDSSKLYKTNPITGEKEEIVTRDDYGNVLPNGYLRYYVEKGIDGVPTVNTKALKSDSAYLSWLSKKFNNDFAAMMNYVNNNGGLNEAGQRILGELVGYYAPGNISTSGKNILSYADAIRHANAVKLANEYRNNYYDEDPNKPTTDAVFKTLDPNSSDYEKQRMEYEKQDAARDFRIRPQADLSIVKARGGSMPTQQKKPTKPSPEWIKNQYGLMAHIAPGYSNDEWDVYI